VRVLPLVRCVSSRNEMTKCGRYRFTVDTIVIAKEDGLLLPPELLHDPERRCDGTRRHVDALNLSIRSESVISLLLTLF
jgi:hypothetical protein